MEAGTSGFLSISDSVRKVPRVVTGESGIVLCGGMDKGDRDRGDRGQRRVLRTGTSGYLSISDSACKVPRVVTGESGIVLCGGMELRLLLELFTR